MQAIFPSTSSVMNAPITPVETIQLHSTARTNRVSIPAAPWSA